VVSPLELVFAFAVDGLIGDPRWLPHPVRMMGSAITRTESFLRRRLKDRLGGVLLVIIIVGVSFLAALGFHKVLRLSTRGVLALFSSAAMVYLISTTVALRGLVDSAKGVLEAVKEGDIGEARLRLSHIVGRDTESLNEEDILRATIETLAENTSDGVIAPLFYLATGGLPLAIAYKAVNTLDSMVGYKNDRYKDFGWAAARLDDILNYIPARVTGALIAVSSAFVSCSLSTAFSSLKTMFQDGRKHPSPNSGVPEAAMAGALGVRLGGASTYGGVTVKKPYIGKDNGKNLLDATRQAINITIATALLGLLVSVSGVYLWWRM
jgi:adenosylcobinamide-phosphate synthase